MPSKVLLFDDEDISEYIGTWKESANARLNAVSVPRRHGALLSDAVVQDVRQIQVAGTLVSPDRTAMGLRTILDDLIELFSRLNKRLQIWDDRYIIAYKASFTWKYIEGSGLTAADFQLNFTCPDPFWHYIAASDTTFTLTPLTAIDITNFLYSKTITFTNNGSFVGYPAYTFTAVGNSIVRLVLRNATSGRQFTYTGTILPGTSLVVDVTNFTVTNDGVEDLINWSGDFVWLLNGANSFEIALTASGTPSALNTLTAAWADRNY